MCWRSSTGRVRTVFLEMVRIVKPGSKEHYEAIRNPGAKRHRLIPASITKRGYPGLVCRTGTCVEFITPSKDAVAFMIFNATDLDLPKGLFEGPPERKWIKIREGQATDYAMLAKLLVQASSSL